MKRELLLNTAPRVGITPITSVAATLSGPIYDTKAFESAIFQAMIGAVTGTPTDLDVVVTLYHGNAVDSVSAPTTITDEAATTYVLTLANVQAGNANDFICVLLDGLKRYVRAKAVLTFAGGTTPAAAISGVWVMGDPQYTNEVPVAQNVSTYVTQ